MRFWARLAVSLVAFLAVVMMASHNPAQAEAQSDLPAGVKFIAGEAIEGGLILARVSPGTRLTLDGDELPVAADGHFMIGFHRDSDDPLTLSVTLADGTEQTAVLRPTQRIYDIQRIDGLKRDYVSPPQAVLDRISADLAAVRAARSLAEAGRYSGDFRSGFDQPATGRISGIYGSQRILNGEPRQPHYGIDIAAPRGTPVHAPAGGRITLVKDLYFSGWTVLMAHGMGLNSAFLHLDKVLVKEGAQVARGTVIGTVGSTGRSTGPHLDWRLDWKGRRLDPDLVSRQLSRTPVLN